MRLLHSPLTRKRDNRVVIWYESEPSCSDSLLRGVKGGKWGRGGGGSVTLEPRNFCCGARRPKPPSTWCHGQK